MRLAKIIARRASRGQALQGRDLDALVLRPQAWARGMSARTEARTRRYERAATKVQTAWRRHVALVQFVRVRSAALVVQAAWRGKQARAVAADLRYCLYPRPSCPDVGVSPTV